MYKGKLQYCIKKKYGNVHFTYKRTVQEGAGGSEQLTAEELFQTKL